MHNKVYIAEVLVTLHMLLVGKVFWAAVLFIPLYTVQHIRFKKKKKLIMDADS